MNVSQVKLAYFVSVNGIETADSSEMFVSLYHTTPGHIMKTVVIFMLKVADIFEIKLCRELCQ
jgi:hypothetical protein